MYRYIFVHAFILLRRFDTGFMLLRTECVVCCCRFFLFSSVCSVLFCFAFYAIEPNGAFDHIVLKIAAFTYI